MPFELSGFNAVTPGVVDVTVWPELVLSIWSIIPFVFKPDVRAKVSFTASNACTSGQVGYQATFDTDLTVAVEKVTATT